MADSTSRTRRRTSGSSTRSGSSRKTTGTRKRATSGRSTKRSTTTRKSQSSQGAQSPQQGEGGLGTGKLVAIGAAVGGLAGTALLLRKLRQHTDDQDYDDEEYDDEQDVEDDEPRGQAEDEGDESDEDDEEPDDEEPEDEDDEDEDPRGEADLDDEDEYDDEEDDDEPEESPASSRARDDDGDERGLASTVWEAVVEGVRSSQGTKSGKSARARGSDPGEEDDASDREPRGATKTGRSASTRAPRGKGSDRKAERTGDENATGVVRQARRHLAELTGKQPESVSGLERGENGTTTVRCEVVELERIPHSTDVLATYELTLDSGGDLVDCSRIARYSRSSGEVGAR